MPSIRIKFPGSDHKPNKPKDYRKTYSTDTEVLGDDCMHGTQSASTRVGDISGSDYTGKNLKKCSNLCPHDEVLYDKCVQCGQLIDIDYGTSFGYIQKGLKLSRGFAESLRQDHTVDLVMREKLHLVLDLDHTLIHCVRAKYLQPEEELLVRGSTKDLYKRVSPRGSMSVIKLRPFVLDFLEKASAMFEMSIYTKGGSVYAAGILRLLDPQGKYFKGRVVAREHTPYYKTLDLILTRAEAIVVVDDKRKMWPDCQPNVIEAARYDYFAGKRKGGSSHCMNKTDESEMDGELTNILKALEEIHRQYFDEEIFDTRLIVPDVVSSVLGRGRS